MENFLKKPLVVPFETLYLDPNNPRLALEDPPSYENPKKLFDADLQTIVAKALEKDPEQRYQSAAAFADDVERYLASQPILAHPPSTSSGRWARIARRNSQA